MTPADLIAAGQTLYGPVWQSALARALRNSNGDPLSDRTVRLWIEGKRKISPWADEQILRLLVDRQVQRIEDVLASLSVKGAGTFLFATYASDDDLRLCTGEGWTTAFHSKMITGIVELLRERGVESRAIPISAAAYLKWLGSRPNTAAERSAFAALRAQVSTY
jgi:hypothetical protein